ncbi:MAG: uracil-DNA glycosylase [Candidatus Nanohaloarchaeota archaeon QJJ-9]|nr:uracil-DNA glycosylase [Candidatus Nanohaloarchaeota archaeon QJJ-9]
MDFRDRYSEFFEQLDDKFFDEERFVPAEGTLEAEYMLVGEAPGANEVKEKEPFVGRAGEKMNDILEEIGVEREELYITNLVKVRPPDNRDPRKNEIEAWRPLLDKEILDIDPEVILTMGNFASRQLLDTKKGITQIHGRLFTRNGRKIMPVYHPAATLYDNSKTPVFKEDLKKAFGKADTGQKTFKDSF